MRRPFNNISKRCAMAIMTAAVVMSNEAHMVLHPVIVYADTNDNSEQKTITSGETIDNNNSGGIVTNNGGTVTNNNSGGEVTNNDGGTVTNNNSGGIVTNSGGTVTNNNSGGTVTNSGGTVENNSSGGQVENTGGTVTNNLSGGEVTNNSGGTVTNNNSGGTVINNSGGKTENNSGGEVTNNSGGTLENNSSGGIVTNYDGGKVENNLSGGKVTNNSGGKVENNSSGGHVENTGGTVTNNLSGGTVTNYDDGTVEENYGYVENSSGGIVTNNYSGGTVTGSGTVENNYGGMVSDDILVSNQYWSVSITGLNTNAEAAYTSGFTSKNSGNYVQSTSDGTPLQKAQGLIKISPNNGYKISGSNKEYNGEAFKYTLTKSEGFYTLVVYPNKNTEIGFDQLNLVISAITSGGTATNTTITSGGTATNTTITSGGTATSAHVTSGGTFGGSAVVIPNGGIIIPVVIPGNDTSYTDSDDDYYGGSASIRQYSSNAAKSSYDAVVQNGITTSWIPGYIETALNIAGSAVEGMIPTQVVLDFSTNPVLTQYDVIALFASHSNILKRCEFLHDGQRYELVIPAVSNVIDPMFVACLNEYKQESLNGPVSLKRLAEIFEKWGVKLNKLE